MEPQNPQQYPAQPQPQPNQPQPNVQPPAPQQPAYSEFTAAVSNSSDVEPATNPQPVEQTPEVQVPEVPEVQQPTAQQVPAEAAQETPAAAPVQKATKTPAKPDQPVKKQKKSPTQWLLPALSGGFATAVVAAVVFLMLADPLEFGPQPAPEPIAMVSPVIETKAPEAKVEEPKWTTEERKQIILDLFAAEQRAQAEAFYLQPFSEEQDWSNWPQELEKTGGLQDILHEKYQQEVLAKHSLVAGDVAELSEDFLTYDDWIYVGEGGNGIGELYFRLGVHHFMQGTNGDLTKAYVAFSTAAEFGHNGGGAMRNKIAVAIPEDQRTVISALSDLVHGQELEVAVTYPNDQPKKKQWYPSYHGAAAASSSSYSNPYATPSWIDPLASLTQQRRQRPEKAPTTYVSTPERNEGDAYDLIEDVDSGDTVWRRNARSVREATWWYESYKEGTNEDDTLPADLKTSTEDEEVCEDGEH